MKRKLFGKSASILSGKGFYIALGISLVAIAIATIVAVNKTYDDIDENNTLDGGSALTSDWGFMPTDDVVKPESNIKPSPSSSEKSSSSQASSTASEKQKPSSKPATPQQTSYAMPLNGEIIVPYSDYEMVYNQTLKSWQTHNGIDVFADLGTPVKSCADGVIKDITNDDLWGVAVIIEHPDGLLSHYNGLAKSVTVKVGQTVKIGDVIGTVGDTANSEILEKTHLHFALQNDDKWVDPFTLIKTIK